jgi:hypothetical protein
MWIIHTCFNQSSTKFNPFILFTLYGGDVFITILFTLYGGDVFITILFTLYGRDVFITILFTLYGGDVFITILFTLYGGIGFSMNVNSWLLKKKKRKKKICHTWGEHASHYTTDAVQNIVSIPGQHHMSWINKSIETHSFFHILSLPFINKTPIPLQYLSSIILWL